MKLLLIFPPSKHGVKSLFLQTDGAGIGHKPPLGILYIASYIKNNSNHEVRLIDLNARPLNDNMLLKSLEDIKPDVIGITCWTDFWFPTWQLLKIIKNTLPKVHIVLGGPHTDIYPLQILTQKNVDSIILGDGEVPMLSLLNHIEFGHPLVNPGIYLKKYPLPQQFYPYVENNLDNLPFPERTLLPLEDYTSILSHQSKISTIITSRGCPYQCIYCKLNFQKSRYRNVTNVIEEMEEISKLNIDEVEIYDDTFTGSRERLVQICQGIIERQVKLKWSIRDRVSSIDEETIELMKRAGCIRIHLGIESGNERVLRRIKKNISLEQAKEEVLLAKKAGLDVLVYFMIGLPGETKKEVLETIEFALQLDSDYATFNIAIPYPGTEMYMDGLSKKIIPADFWQEYTLNPKPNFSLPYLYEEFLKKDDLIHLRNLAIKKYYFRPKFLLNKLLNCISFREVKKKSRMGLNLFWHSYVKNR